MYYLARLCFFFLQLEVKNYLYDSNIFIYRSTDTRTLENEIIALELTISDEATLYEALKSSDRNKDGKLTRLESENVLRMFGIGDSKKVDKVFDSLNRGVNGTITFREFKHFLTAQTKIDVEGLKAELNTERKRKKHGEKKHGEPAVKGGEKDRKKGN